MNYRRFSRISFWRSNQSRNSCSWAGVIIPCGSGKMTGLITPSYTKAKAMNAIQNPMMSSIALTPCLSQPKSQPIQSFMRSESDTPRIVARRDPRHDPAYG
jgi:hypothetical protein